MVDTLVLEANAEKREGSSPFARTKKNAPGNPEVFFVLYFLQQFAHGNSCI